MGGGRSDIPDDLGVAHRLADAADAVTTARFGALDLRVETKPDLTPVTDADRAVEQELRRLLATERPDDVVLGEEYGEGGGAGTTRRRWVIDPIDGTKNFVRGVPVWATLVALEADGEGMVGVVSAPALGRRWWAARGAGAWVRVHGAPDPRPCRVSGVERLADASLSYSSLSGWEVRGRAIGFRALADACWRTRAYGDFWSYALLAEGAVDIATEPEVSLWDLLAVSVLVEEAGGRFTDLDGRRGAGGGSALATNGRLHDAVLARVGPLDPGLE